MPRKGINELFSRTKMLQLLWLVYEKETDNAFLFPLSLLILQKNKNKQKRVWKIFLEKNVDLASNSFLPFLREQTCLSYSLSGVKLS